MQTTFGKYMLSLQFFTNPLIKLSSMMSWLKMTQSRPSPKELKIRQESGWTFTTWHRTLVGAHKRTQRYRGMHRNPRGPGEDSDGASGVETGPSSWTRVIPSLIFTFNWNGGPLEDYICIRTIWAVTSWVSHHCTLTWSDLEVSSSDSEVTWPSLELV